MKHRDMLAICGLIGFGLTFLIGCDRGPSTPTSAGSNPQQEEDLAAAYEIEVQPSAEEDDTEALAEATAQVQGMFDEIATLMTAGEHGQVADRIDIGRLIDEIAAHGVSVGQNRTERNEFGKGMRIGMVQSIAKGEVFAPGSPHLVQHIRLIPDSSEAIAYTRRHDASGYTIKTRWWLIHDGYTWRIYDIEDLSVSLRSSVLMAGMISSSSELKLASWSTGLKEIVGVAGLLKAEQWLQAQSILEKADLTGAPSDVRAVKWMLLASAQMGQEHFDEAMESIRRAEEYNKDMPMLDYLPAAIHIRLERFEQALHHIDRYMDRLGGEADIYLFQMLALNGLGRHGEAVQAGERLLDDSPTSDSLAEFGLMLNEDEKPRIADLIVKLEIKADSFELIGESFYEADDIPALRAAVLGFTRADPASVDTAYYDALVKYSDQSYAESADRLRPVIGQITDPEARQPFLDLYWASMRLSGQARRAYDEADDPTAAFLGMASKMYWDGQLEALHDLSLAHIERSPANPWGYYYAGVCLATDEDWDAADGHFEHAFARATTQEHRDEVRYEWVDSLNKAGRWRTVRDRIGRDDAIINQIMWFHINQQDPKALDELLLSRDQNTPTIGRAYVYSMQGAHGMAAQYLTTYRQAFRTEEALYAYDDLLIRSLVRAERFDDAMKRARESTEYDGDPYYELIVYIASGDAGQAIKTAQACLDLGSYTTDGFYEDDLILKHVSRYRMKSFREKFPPPETAEASE